MDDHDELVTLRAKVESMESIVHAYFAPKPQPQKLRLGKLSKSSIGVSIFFGIVNFLRFMFLE